MKRAELQSSGFSLLEVLVAFTIASLAISWYLYYLSQVHFLAYKTTTSVKRIDESWRDFLLFRQTCNEEAPVSSHLLEGEDFCFRRLVFQSQGVEWSWLATCSEEETGLFRGKEP